ncbi:MAG: hypothetical protein ACOYN3_05460 [Acidimicrobiia bacterium]
MDRRTALALASSVTLTLATGITTAGASVGIFGSKQLAGVGSLHPIPQAEEQLGFPIASGAGDIGGQTATPPGNEASSAQPTSADLVNPSPSSTSATKGTQTANGPTPGSAKVANTTAATSAPAPSSVSQTTSPQPTTPASPTTQSTAPTTTAQRVTTPTTRRPTTSTTQPEREDDD